MAQVRSSTAKPRQPKTAASRNPEATRFGTRAVTPPQKTQAVEGVFTSVAERYDLMNDIMSLGLHRLWKDQLVRAALLGKRRFPPPLRGRVRVRDCPPPAPPLQGEESLRIIDVAGGTGDIAFRLYRALAGACAITVADLTPAMLEVGRARAIDHGILPYPPPPVRGRVRVGDSPPPAPPLQGGEPLVQGRGGISFLQANAEHLPFATQTFDLYTIAFGLRNVTHIDDALVEAYRVLKPGGRFACLEFSQVQDQVLDTVYQLWSRAIPSIGAVVTDDRASYQYLVESIRAFPTQAQLARRIKAAGFDRVSVQNLTGGIAAIHIAEKY